MRKVEKLTIAKIEEKGSKFIAYAYPLAKLEELKPLLAILKKEHKKARHICYAYVIDDKLYGFHNDSEPAGTAGKPIFEVLQGRALVCSVVFVVRYFGGTLLGTGLLSRSYREACKLVLDEAGLSKTSK